MENEELQVENGHFTRIVNPLIEQLITIPFKGCELAVALFIIRKTYGFNKIQDAISLTQFQQGLQRSRPVIVKALKNLLLVKVAKLVKRGDSKKASNIWAINKYFNTWELVKVAKLVKHFHSTSKASHKQLVKPALHTKDNIQKTYTKDIVAISKKSPTHTQEIKKFLETDWYHSEATAYFVVKGLTAQEAQDQLNEFIAYWREKTKSGKQRWELEKAFEVKRRLGTWVKFYNERQQRFTPKTLTIKDYTKP